MKLWSNDTYIFSIVSSGINVYSSTSKTLVNHIPYSNNFAPIFADSFINGDNWTSISNPSSVTYTNGYMRHTADATRTRSTSLINFGTEWIATFRMIQYGRDSTNDQLYIYPAWTSTPGGSLELYLRTYSAVDMYLSVYVQGTQRALITKYNWYNNYGKWINVKIQRSGTNLYLKVWIPPDPEPVAWDVSTTCTMAFPTLAQFDMATNLTANSGTGVDDIIIGTPAQFANNFRNITASCLWADDEYLYFGTNFSGIQRSLLSSINYSKSFSTFKSYPDITSNTILDICGHDDYICAVTDSGIDEIHISTANHYFTTLSGATRCFQTASGIYYTVAGTLHAVYDVASNWTTPDYSYNSSTHESFFNITNINDLHVKDGLIYIATNNGIVIIKEERGSEASSDYKRFKEI